MSHHSISGMAIAKAFMGTISVLAAIVIVFTAGPAIERTYFPVLGKLQFLEVRPFGPETSIVKVRFAKNRDCEYMGIAWYYGVSPGISERVSMIPVKDPNDTSSPNRIVGMQNAGPWRINIPASAVRTKSYVVAYHRCHPLWTSATVFYP